MTRDKAVKIVRDAITDHGYDKRHILSLASSPEDLDYDSLDLVEVGIRIEEIIDEDFDIPDLSAIRIVEDIVKLVEMYE